MDVPLISSPENPTEVQFHDFLQCPNCGNDELSQGRSTDVSNSQFGHAIACPECDTVATRKFPSDKAVAGSGEEK